MAIFFFKCVASYFFYAFHASIAHVHFGHISSLNELVLASVGLYLGLILCNSRKKKELILFAKPESEKIHDFAYVILERAHISSNLSSIELSRLNSNWGFKGVFTCSILASIVTLLLSIVVILTSIDPILEKCGHLLVQYLR